MGDAVPPPAPAFPLGLQAVAFWSDRVPDWQTARQLLRSGNAPAEGEPLRPPPPQMLQGAERRRASPAVALGLELARLALAEAGVDAQAVEAVFTSSHGDVMVTDEICRTLAQDPALLAICRRFVELSRDRAVTSQVFNALPPALEWLELDPELAHSAPFNGQPREDSPCT